MFKQGFFYLRHESEPLAPLTQPEQLRLAGLMTLAGRNKALYVTAYLISLCTSYGLP
jgi:hypothetical protein